MTDCIATRLSCTEKYLVEISDGQVDVHIKVFFCMSQLYNDSQQTAFDCIFIAI